MVKYYDFIKNMQKYTNIWKAINSNSGYLCMSRSVAVLMFFVTHFYFIFWTWVKCSDDWVVWPTEIHKKEEI